MPALILPLLIMDLGCVLLCAGVARHLTAQRCARMATLGWLRSVQAELRGVA